MRGKQREQRELEFTAFVAVQGTRLQQLARLLVSSPRDAEDLVQTALTQTYVHWDGISGDILAYASRCMVNTRTDWWRRSRNREQSAAIVRDQIGVADFAEQTATRDQLREALARLTSRERSVVVLRYYLDQSEQQISEHIGVAPGTVKSTLSRALKKLRIDETIGTKSGRQ